MDQPINYIPKSEMIGGAYYVGICRNSYVAEWDGKKEEFVYIRYKFGYLLDNLEHFEDVKDSGTDGFVPLQKLDNPKGEPWFKEFENQIGY